MPLPGPSRETIVTADRHKTRSSGVVGDATSPVLQEDFQFPYHSVLRPPQDSSACTFGLCSGFCRTPFRPEAMLSSISPCCILLVFQQPVFLNAKEINFIRTLSNDGLCRGKGCDIGRNNGEVSPRRFPITPSATSFLFCSQMQRQLQRAARRLVVEVE